MRRARKATISIYKWCKTAQIGGQSKDKDNGIIQKVKSALQHVVLAPWRSGPVGTFYSSSLEVSSNPPVFLFSKKECSLS